MKRGEIWTASGGQDYAGKPRPVVIVQDDNFENTSSITVCPCTSDPTEMPIFRLLVEPTATNGLQIASNIMVDRITTMPKRKLGKRIGKLNATDMVRLNRAIFVFLGLAS